MGTSKNVRTISQEAFDEFVRENVDDLGMDPAEALQDAIETLTLQGVDLSGIITCIPGVSSVKDNPVFQSLDALKEINSKYRDGDDEPSTTGFSEKDLDDMVSLLDKLSELCSIEGSGNVSIATRNGGVELVCSICSKLQNGHGRSLVSALKTLTSLLHDFQSRETFQKSSGPKIVVDILNSNVQNISILNNGFSIVAAAATGNEILKESFMDLKIEQLLIQIMRAQSKGNIQSLYDAIRILLTPDDNRVVASQVYGYARKFAEIGIPGALVEALSEGLSSPSLVSASIALKAVAVNDEICRSIAENDGIDAILQCIDDSGEQNNKTVARAFCSLLSKLAGSDVNKTTIVQKRGMDRLMKLSCRFPDDPSVLQEPSYWAS
ncbi:PREDICTED: armadillo repeat-containing protein 6 isoform X2 [Nelumbo nucifera]|uniref:Armadillo repeat-containing protein 6 isoform X2 n=1 Tax=Nelumbo nucifera TaxID=4432 RepID=A0A1U8AYQ0_NELNU|nr:PREDICTED: armadillo repeat-containing protein 6 isoform X2 [Nelumbo nucifera]